jgi:hypothetical protein
MRNSQYNRMSDSLLSWNKDICRRETGTIAGKGNPFRRCRRRCTDPQLIYFSRRNCLPLGVFAMTDLRESSVVAKYEGHLVSQDGTIQIRCTRTDILFTFRADLNRELTHAPFSREHCASVKVTTVTLYFYTVFHFFPRFLHHNLQLYVGQTKQFEDRWNPPSGRLFCGFVAQSGRCTMGSTSQFKPRQKRRQ